MRPHAGKWIIYYACMLHLMWAALMPFSIDTFYTVPTSPLIMFDGYWTPIVLVLASGAAWFALNFEEHVTGLYGLLLCIPQQMLLLIGSMAAIKAVVLGHYVDGTVRSWLFILTDQSAYILTGIFHTFALLERYTKWAQLWSRLKPLGP